VSVPNRHFSPVEVFRALASEARLRMVRELSTSEEKCVCELVECCGLGWSTVSHHLSILKQAGIVADEKRGQQVFYRLTMPCVTHFIRCLEKPNTVPGMDVAVCCR
jgi:DNA-binding transcriptional ArsR family regulator